MKIEELYSIYQQHPSVETDTRKLKSGDLFFALKGPNFNANVFAQKAINAGAAKVVIDDAKYFIEGKTILVDDVLETLQQLAKHHRQNLAIPFFAITGSNGKTTTKELVHGVLSSRFKTYTTEGNLNNHIGVPLTILKIRNDAEMAVIEMGANHVGEIASYCQYTMPTHGLITNCGKAHLEGFGSEEGVRKGKGELFDWVRQHKGTAFIMNDYDYLRQMSSGIENIFTYGSGNANVEGQAIPTEIFLTVQFEKGFSGTIKTSLVGDYNLPNVLAAVAVGKFFGVAEEKIRTAIENYQPTNSRSQMIEKGGHKIILDAYNANPSSMKVAIENFVKSTGKNKILVLGAMAELGTSSLEEHQVLIEEIKKHLWKAVLLVGGDFLQIQNPYKTFATVEEAGSSLKNIAPSFLLVKGSRSMQMEKVIEYLQ